MAFFPSDESLCVSNVTVFQDCVCNQSYTLRVRLELYLKVLADKESSSLTLENLLERQTYRKSLERKWVGQKKLRSGNGFFYTFQGDNTRKWWCHNFERKFFINTQLSIPEGQNIKCSNWHYIILYYISFQYMVFVNDNVLCSNTTRGQSHTDFNTSAPRPAIQSNFSPARFRSCQSARSEPLLIYSDPCLFKDHIRKLSFMCG